jgi:hypothetical protein
MSPLQGAEAPALNSDFADCRLAVWGATSDWANKKNNAGLSFSDDFSLNSGIYKI